MSSFRVAIKFLLVLLSSTLPVPEIWAEPVPYFLDKRANNYVVPLSERGPGHRGIDIVASSEKISSPVNGTVVFNDSVAQRRVLSLSYGPYRISLEPLCSELEIGTRVSAGEAIGHYCHGEDGYEEHCEKCVHLSVRTSRGYLNPLLFYGQLNPSRIVG